MKKSPWKNNTAHAVEITPEAAHVLIGNDEKSWADYEQNELAEMTVYRAHGLAVFAICNFASGITQWYIQDINA